MTRWASPRSATSLWVVVVGLSLLGAVFGFWRDDIPGGVAALLAMVVPSAGLVVARHVPRNPVGWSLLVGSLFGSLGTVGVEYVPLALAHGWTPWLARLGAWLEGVTWVLAAVAALVMTAYFFPDGRLVSPRLRLAVKVTFVASGLWIVLFTAMTWGLSAAEINSDDTPSPTGVRGLIYLVAVADVIVLAISALIALASLAVRWRRAGELVRVQLQWVFAALVLVALSLVGSTVVDYGSWQNTIETTVLGLVAVATGVAVLRYRLYDIDRLVSRTVTYLVALGLLAGAYAGIVIGIGALVPAELGSLGVALATLVVVMAFLPLTRRIRHAVDRRFDRRRYDIQRTIATFASRVRQRPEATEVDADLIAVVARTVQPAHAGLWLAPR